jgi:hypothetical protein
MRMETRIRRIEEALSAIKSEPVFEWLEADQETPDTEGVMYISWASNPTWAEGPTSVHLSRSEEFTRLNFELSEYIDEESKEKMAENPPPNHKHFNHLKVLQVADPDKAIDAEIAAILQELEAAGYTPEEIDAAVAKDDGAQERKSHELVNLFQRRRGRR